MLAAATTLTPVTEPDFTVLRELAGTIWRQHYAAIIPDAQIEYMLAGRFSDEALRGHIQAADRWLELLRVSGEPVGYCGYELAATDGDGSAAADMKLGQLYVLDPRRGMGLGRYMLRHVEDRACERGSGRLWLQVKAGVVAGVKNPLASYGFGALGSPISHRADRGVVCQ